MLLLAHDVLACSGTDEWDESEPYAPPWGAAAAAAAAPARAAVPPALEVLSQPTMPALKSLDLSHCTELPAATLSKILERHGPSLSELLLLGCTQLGAPTLMEIATHCTALTSLSFEHTATSPALPGDPAAEAQQHEAVSLLETAVGEVAQAFGERLVSLSLEGCHLLTDKAMQSVAESCGSGAAASPLRRLSLNNGARITDRTLLALSEHTPHLEEVDLSWCRELTDEGLGILTDRCTRLKRLKVWGCTQLTSVFLEGHARHDLEIVGRPSRPPLRTQDA